MTMWGGESAPVTHDTNDAYPLRVARAGMVAPLPHNTEYITPQTDAPKVVARDRAIPLTLITFVISLTGTGLVAVLPIDREWLPAIGFVTAAINGAAIYYLRAVGEGEKDQGRAERI